MLKIFKMKIRILKTEKEYEKALERLDEIFDASENTPKGDEAELLMLLIENYEDQHFPINLSDPIEAIKFRMEQLGLKQQDLAKIIGYKSRVSEIFSRKRKLTLKMIRNLHEQLNIPYESLMVNY